LLDVRLVLLALMEALAGDAHLSFEGDLHGFRLREIAGAIDQETATLKRNTRWPDQDFVVVPLEPATVRPVFSAIGGNVPRRILHVQIEKGGKLAFGAYDRFSTRTQIWETPHGFSFAISRSIPMPSPRFRHAALELRNRIRESVGPAPLRPRWI
jgi:hypothetical protein